MKKLVLIFAILFSSFFELIAQTQDTKFLIEEYIKQSERQKKTATILMGAGGGAIALSFLLALTADDWNSPGFEGGVFLFFAGSATVLIGIPIIVSSAANARKAGRLSLELNSARVLNPENPPKTIYPALKISLPLNSSRR
ncbi:hypothetical protein [Algoriphagus pacificus]|uniref:Uncharacterized protein n=1 Tax=Algoriphagus pacificus TaxID=2811234 RepID=A0ABS3CKV2_9BACT|nr:hypothetical protein [Algoriphagus pacificus]MBN7817722.1 hypothetical protein [Algoriphagus pacificus]